MTDHLSKIRPVLKTLPPFFFLTVIAIISYGNSFNAPFVFDDLPQIIENPHIRITGYSSDIPARLMNCRNPNRFLAYATFALNYYVHQYEVAGYHLVNVIIHIITAFLVFLIARMTSRLCDEKPSVLLPFLAAALWLVSPVHTQSATYIVQRMNAMAAMFTLLALCCFVRARLMQRSDKSGLKPILLYAGVGFSGLCGLAAKETGAILPIVLLLYEWYFFQDLNRAWIKKQLAWINVVLLLLIIIGFVYMGWHPLERLTHMYEEHDFTMGQRLLTEPRVVLYYLTLLVFPHPSRLTLDYNFPLSLSSFNPATTLPAILGLVALIVIAVYTARRHRLFSFAIIWFLVTLVIESSFIGLAIIFEHRTYLPSVFVAIGLVWLMFSHLRPKIFATLLLCLAIGISSLWTHQRNNTWNNPISLWQDTIQKSLGKALHYNNIGAIFAEQGISDKAVNYYKKALQLDPKYTLAYNNLGVELSKTGRRHEAIDAYRTVLTIDPEYDSAHYNLGNNLLQAGFIDAAISHYEAAVRLKPDNINMLNNLGSAYTIANRLEDAINCYLRALRIDPDSDLAIRNLATVLANFKDIEKAVDRFLRPELSRRQLARVYNRISIICLEKKDLATAEE